MPHVVVFLETYAYAYYGVRYSTGFQKGYDSLKTEWVSAVGVSHLCLHSSGWLFVLFGWPQWISS